MAVQHYQAERLAEAKRDLNAIQDRYPDLPEVLHLLALIALRTGRAELAVGYLEKAVASMPSSAELFHLLGGALRQTNRLADAIGAYRRAIDLDPGMTETHFNLGNALKDSGHAAEAIDHYRRATELKPDFGDAYYNLGSLLRKAGRAEEAVAALTAATAANPKDAEAFLTLADGHDDLGDSEKALAASERAIAIDPNLARAYFNHANLLARSDRADEAIADYRRALALDPGMTTAHDLLGVLYHRLGRLDDAIASFRTAIAVDPNFADAHANLGSALLLNGNLSEGWQELEWRWRGGERGQESRAVPQPPWRGGPVAGKTVLVWAEQGVGDEILFSSMVPDLKAAGARVVLESDERLVPLFERSFSDVNLIARRDPPTPEVRAGDIDFQAALGNLGRYLRPNLESFPSRGHFLVADPVRSGEFAAKYRQRDGDLLVGISWASKNVEVGRQKSMTLADLRPLARMPSVTLVDLQYGDTVAERAAFEEATGKPIVHDKAVDQMTDLDAFAAQVAAMDLVITISNTTAHMAGALGVPTWVMVHTVPLSCWMLGREDSPWYPSVRLFRQSRPGQWAEVIGRVAAALKEFAKATPPGLSDA